MLNVYSFGYGGSVQLAEELRPMIEELGMKLTTIHEHDNADIQWDRSTWLDHLRNADIIILPTKYDVQPAKSNNRLTQSLALGKPVICSPLPAYERIVKQYNCALIAYNDEDWKKHLETLKDEKIRKELSQNGFEASKEYSIDSIANQWLNVIQNVEKTDIIIPTYNNLPCLKLCLDSIRKCTKVLYNIIVVNNGTDEATNEYLANQGDIVYIKKGRLNFAQAINVGLKASKEKYVCLLNDDTIVSEGWLQGMIDACTGNVGGVGLLSNCDKGWKHNIDINIGGVELLPGTNTIEQITPIIDKIHNYRDERLNGSVPFVTDWIAFYCILIPRHVINQVGLLDERFTNSGEDVDYCNRIKKQDYKLVETYKSFVFHFGAVGRKILESENIDEYQEQQRSTNVYLQEKWNKPSIAIYSGASWEKWDFRNLVGGIGGSENWVIYLSREFSKLGYRVVVFADCPESGIRDGEVEWHHYTEYTRWIEQNWVDYFISSRLTDPLNYNIRSGKNYVMIHDVWIMGGNKVPLYINKVDKYCVLSEWHRDFVSDYHGISKDKIWMTSNGLDFGRFNKNVEREPYRMMYSSSLDRGLDTLLYLFDFIKTEIPELELHIFYGMDNWEKSIKLRGNEWEINKMNEIKAGMKKDGVFYHGRVGQEQLAEEWLRSSLWAYPTDFEETFSITAIEAQTAGLPVIATNYAGLRTTVGDSGILIGNGTKGQSYTKEFRVEFVKNCVNVLKNEEEWNKWSQKSVNNVIKYEWKNVAQKWVELFNNPS